MIGNKNKNIAFIHIILWSVVFVLPYFFIDKEAIFRFDRFFRALPNILGFVIVFYVNYFVLIKKYLFKGKTKTFILYNLIMIIGISILVFFINETHIACNPMISQRKRIRLRPSPFIFIIRDIASLITMTGLSVAIKMTIRWFEVENERKELEKAKSEAELQNLKTQISPHFLLNTLNNIYALIEFNPKQAQEAVLHLSKLMRNVLYDNNRPMISIHQEVDFMKNYIYLMKMRLPKNVQLKTEFIIDKNSQTTIAPLIFISLVENAFKHGVSGDKPSFIHIYVADNSDGKVIFAAKNSYFPKSKQDKSGSGIGLKLVQKRLSLIYPQRHTLNTQTSDNKHSITLTIYTKELTNDTKLLDN